MSDFSRPLRAPWSPMVGSYESMVMQFMWDNNHHGYVNELRDIHDDFYLIHRDAPKLGHRRCELRARTRGVCASGVARYSSPAAVGPVVARRPLDAWHFADTFCDLVRCGRAWPTAAPLERTSPAGLSGGDRTDASRAARSIWVPQDRGQLCCSYLCGVIAASLANSEDAGVIDE